MQIGKEILKGGTPSTVEARKKLNIYSYSLDHETLLRLERKKRL